MKVLSVIFTVVLMCIFVRPAKAYQMIVIDPGTEYTHITSSSTAVPIQACPDPSDPSDPLYGYMSCAYGTNYLTTTITSANVFVPDNPDGPGECGTTSTSGVTCNAVDDPADGGYIFTFTGLKVTEYNSLILALTVPQDELPADLTLTINAATPEPESLTLLATGLLSGATVLRRRRA